VEFARSYESLAAVFDMIALFLRHEGIDAALGFDLDLIAEELFTNMVKYGNGAGPVDITITRDGDHVALVFRDEGTQPFDVTRPRPLPTDVPLAERRPGGLGLGLVQRMADGFDYRHDGRTGTTTVRKRIVR